MSDAFSDLWQSSNPSQSQNKPKRTIGNSHAQQAASILPWAHQAAKSDAFTILASTSATPSRAITPARAQAPPKPSARNGDSFGDLVSFGTLSSTTKQTSMSLAAQQRPPTSSQSKPVMQASEPDALWSQIDILGSTTSSSKPVQHVASSDPWDIDFVGTTPGVRPQPIVQPPMATRHDKPVSASSASIFDLLGDLEGSETIAPTVQSRERATPLIIDKPSQATSTSEFDLTFNKHEDEDDILGMLAKPVQVVLKDVSPPLSEQKSSMATSLSGRVSPPPHLIGQIVEMGFSVEQARIALAATSTGLDVPGALETLLQSSMTDHASSSFRDNIDSEDEREQEREREHKRRLHHERRRRPEPSTRDISDAESGAASVTAQADRILAQATELGMSMLTKANTFWNVGKERVQKAYEDHTATSGRSSASGSPAPSKGVTPRWMHENVGNDEASPVDGTASVFKDDDDDDEPASAPSRGALRSAPAVPAYANTSNSVVSDLLSTEPRRAGSYRSPFRSGAKANETVSPKPSRGTSPLVTPTISVPQLPSFPFASPSTLATAAVHKAKANETFKLGSYPAAITSYTAALDLLPERHMSRVSLLTNRALASIRIGEWKSAIDDCSAALSLISASPSGGEQLYLGTVPTAGSSTDGTNLPGETIYLGDALLKAFSRRAAAFEMGENWSSALADWESTLASARLPMSTGGGTNGKLRIEATRGTERCKKMIRIVSGASSEQIKSMPPQSPRPLRQPPPRVAPVNEVPSEAVQRLRAANAAASAEEQTKSELKDVVDSKLQAWKSGKETNIRALIASLDLVLWPELGWQTVGMAELISPNQLKIRYMKAIAKLHPDKLNVENTTVEQRMIANGVFATLNEAWTALKM